eukprot:TRINITY_DN22590_c0_g1_i1.p1 TRINITY_DN22590_c0_g1~~TRINITY_DN22590_c0_g1_i1.p1  ORF type:complete len:176 (+),score=24.53 TRINITY_DN22590_c0_g1_i1:33-530(+)
MCIRDRYLIWELSPKRRTLVTDAGVSAIASEISYLPLKTFDFALDSCQITDLGMLSLAESLRNVSSLLGQVQIWVNSTSVSDVGIIAIVDAFSALPHLSTLLIAFHRCEAAVTDLSAEKLRDLLNTHPKITDIKIGLSKTGITQDGIQKIRQAKKEQHSKFFISS